MIKGRVIGKVWASKRIDAMAQGPLLEIETADGSKLIAIDPMGCGPGEQVLVVQGSVAERYFQQPNALIDALIIGSINEQN